MKIFRNILLVCSLLVFTSCGSDGGSEATEAEPSPPPTPSQAEILQKINAARAIGRSCGAEGFFAAAGPLTWNNLLFDTAEIHGIDMHANDFFSHTGSNGLLVDDRGTNAGYVWAAIGENLAKGQQTLDEAVQGWIDSDGHCKNLMDPLYDEMGLHVVGTGSDIYWTKVMGKHQ